MTIEATPPKLPTTLDLWLRPAAVEIRPAPTPRGSFTLTYVGMGQCKPLTATTPDDDPPRMLRTLATSTSSGTLSYDDCSLVAVVTGQPYALDIRIWGAQSDAIIERLNHDYAAHYVQRGPVVRSAST